MISFTVKGPPVGVNEGYRTVPRGYRAALVLSEAAAWYKASLVQAARAAHRRAGAPRAIEQGAIVGVRFVFPTLGSDIDGSAKFVLDAVSAGSRSQPGARLVVNDTRVRQVVLVKGDCDGTPRTEVAVASLEEPGCPACGCRCRVVLPTDTGHLG